MSEKQLTIEECNLLQNGLRLTQVLSAQLQASAQQTERLSVEYRVAQSKFETDQASLGLAGLVWTLQDNGSLLINDAPATESASEA